MEIPTPVDISRLKGILSNAKSIMKKVESNDYTTGNVDPRALTEEGVQELYHEGVQRPAMQPQPLNTSSQDYAQMVNNSRLPDSIKQAMIAKPIQQPTMTSNTFSLHDVSDLVEKPMGHPKVRTNQPQRGQQPIRENSTYYNEESDMISISRAELSLMIKEEVMSFLAKSYTETLTESAIKKTINTLIKEGKITTKKRV